MQKNTHNLLWLKNVGLNYYHLFIIINNGLINQYQINIFLFLSLVPVHPKEFQTLYFILFVKVAFNYLIYIEVHF